MINGRCADAAVMPFLDIAIGEMVVDAATGEIIVANVDIADVERCMKGDRQGLKPVEHRQATPVLLRRPWDVQHVREGCLGADCQFLSRSVPALRAGSGVVVIGTRGVYADQTAVIAPTVVLDCEKGPIVIGAHATVRPGAIIIGPASIGEHTTVLERTLVKGGCAIGPWCKIAGELGETVIQGYSNKAHDGHLGNSWLGEWVNLGAGTANSNLLNTYGEVIARATPDGPNERTGLQFFGCVLGDHVKTAISTRIMTGAVANVGVMFAATSPISGCLAPLSWITDAGVREYGIDKFESVCRTVMKRRGVVPTESYMKAVRELRAQAATV
jgi:UDP-N-acetylglucosamine diphosphorylase/glucosamine-1-phosphate N-acetyltransferase